MTSQSDIRHQVRLRAVDRCEYCRMHQSLQGGTFHIEHVIPISRGGDSTFDNLVWACPGCNLHKSDRCEARDEQTNQLVPLFNPRTHLWSEHFSWDGHELVALSAIGRVTIVTLELNHSRRVRIRQAEELFNLFPP